MEIPENVLQALIRFLRLLVPMVLVWMVSILGFTGLGIYLANKKPEPLVAETARVPVQEVKKSNLWHAPDPATLETAPNKDELLYGRELVAHTAQFFGPAGKLKKGATNSLNCQNCHLDAGTRPFGNNYALVASTYPKYRARSGQQEDIPKRVNDCFERSLNGKALDTNSKEMKAMVAYIKWVGKDVPKGSKPEGAGLGKLAFLNRPADPQAGKAIYAQRCAVCHGKDGKGQETPDHKNVIYPPLWGKKSYNQGAGLYRLSNFARYVKYNMPLGASAENPVLSDEEAWDLAAYVNSLDRPSMKLEKDWPRLEEKPVDHPFGPFADGFSEQQHKFGPFQPIEAKKKKAGPPGKAL